MAHAGQHPFPVRQQIQEQPLRGGKVAAQPRIEGGAMTAMVVPAPVIPRWYSAAMP